MAFLIRPPSVTGVVDRLVRDGLVTRQALPQDRRVKEIRLTARGRQRVDDVLAVHGGQIAKVLAGLTSEDQAELQRLLGLLGRHLESLIELGGNGREPENGANDRVVG